MRYLVGLGLFALAVWAANTSMFSAGSDVAPRLIAHRGVHQVDRGEGRDANTCRAAQIASFTHPHIENTIPSMRAAFEAGAEVVEIDVHLTPDGQFAVFHDWRLECQTNGMGVTEETPMAELRALDIGYGFTADGETFPLRGTGVGLMPTLTDVIAADLPGPVFVNFKSRRTEEGTHLAAMLADPEARAAVWGAYGGQEPTRAAQAGMPGLRGFDKKSVMDCLKRYMAFGWSGYVPQACRNTILPVPISHARFVWGWPHRFTNRLKAQGTDVILLGPWNGSGFTTGIDDAETLARVPEGFDGYIWTNRVEVIGELVRKATR